MFCKSGFNKVYLKYKGILAKYYCDNSNFKEISTTEQSIDIDNASFKQAVSKEDRNLFKFFFLLLFNQIEIIKLLFFIGDFDLLPISLSLFFFSIASDYTMNACSSLMISYPKSIITREPSLLILYLFFLMYLDI